MRDEMGRGVDGEVVDGEVGVRGDVAGGALRGGAWGVGGARGGDGGTCFPGEVGGRVVVVVAERGARFATEVVVARRDPVVVGADGVGVGDGGGGGGVHGAAGVRGLGGLGWMMRESGGGTYQSAVGQASDSTGVGCGDDGLVAAVASIGVDRDVIGTGDGFLVGGVLLWMMSRYRHQCGRDTYILVVVSDHDALGSNRLLAGNGRGIIDSILRQGTEPIDIGHRRHGGRTSHLG